MNIAIGVGLCMLSCAMAGLGMGLATGKAVDGWQGSRKLPEKSTPSCCWVSP